MESPFLTRLKKQEEYQKKAYLMGAVTVWALVFFGIFVIRPSLITATALQSKLWYYKKLDKSLEEKQNAINKAKNDYKEIGDKISKVNARIPDKRNEAEFVKEISFIATKSKVSIATLETEISTKPQKGLYIYLVAEGEKLDLFNFIENIQKGERLIDISDLTLLIKENKESELRIKSFIYYL